MIHMHKAQYKIENAAQTSRDIFIFQQIADNETEQFQYDTKYIRVFCIFSSLTDTI